jgi:16S rRNA (guanine(966)-N(2))-methyltransferase RsmD
MMRLEDGLRVIAGELRGRRIEVPKRSDIRPTYDRVRESLFSIIGPRMEGARVLDLFAGTGSLGIESLSRGARSATFVERDPDVASVLALNIERLGLKPESTVLRQAVGAFLKRRSSATRFDIVFADPPYDSGLAERVLEMLGSWDGLSPDSLVVVEHRAGTELPARSGRLAAVRKERYGTIEVEFFEVCATEMTPEVDI